MESFGDEYVFGDALYLLAMIDYLSRINGLPICTNYNDIRSQKLEKPHFPASVVVSYAATGDESIKDKASVTVLFLFQINVV